MKKIILLITLIIATLFYYHLNNKPIYFKKIDKKLPVEKNISLSYDILGYNKPIKVIDLTKNKKPTLFAEYLEHPKIYGFRDKFLISLNQEIALLNTNTLLDAFVTKNYFSNNSITSDDKLAYLVFDNKLHTYNGKRVQKVPYNFNYFGDLYSDKDNIYFNMSAKKRILVLNRDLKHYTFYESNISSSIDYIKNSTIYTKFRKNGKVNLKSISLDNDVKTLIKNSDNIYKFKDYYITKNGNIYNIYKYPKSLVATFNLPKKYLLKFFILKNRLYLIDAFNNKIFAKMDLTDKKFNYIKPVNFYALESFDTNDNFVAFVKNKNITILDDNLNIIKQYKIKTFPDPWSFAIDGNRSAIRYGNSFYLNGKKIFEANREYYTTHLVFYSDYLAIMGSKTGDKKFYIDIFKSDKHIKSYTLQPKASMLKDITFYKDIIVATFESKTVFIKNGKIVKTINYYKKAPDAHLKRVGNMAYLSYLNNLVEINLDTLKIKYNSFHLKNKIRKGESFLITQDNFTKLQTIIKFPDKEYRIISPNNIADSYALKDYAIFRFKSDFNTILAVSKDKIYKLKLVSKYNKIMNIKPLKKNKFAIFDRDGIRVIDLDKIDEQKKK